MTEPGPGWCDDPEARGQLRYWDTPQWTDHHAPGSASQPAPPAKRGGTSPLVMVAIVLGVLFFGGAGCTRDRGADVPRREGATEDRVAQSALRNASAAAKAIYTDTLDYGAVTPAALEAVEPSYEYTTEESFGFPTVSIFGQGDLMVVAMLADTESCWGVRMQDGSTQTGRIMGSCAGINGVNGVAPDTDF